MDTHDTTCQDSSSFHPEQVDIHVEFVAGVSGAVPSTFVRKAGCLGVALSATGIYTFSFPVGPTYYALLNVIPTVHQVTYNAAHASKATLTTNAIRTNPSTVAITTRAEDGTAAALTAGDTLKVTFVVARTQGNG